MIVSASYHDDIPAHYAAWFMRRLDAGYCRTFDRSGLRFHRVALSRDAVDAFVFFTRHAAPFEQALDAVRARGYAFVLQYGITSIPEVERFRALSVRHGARALVWRYEPLRLTETETSAWHEANFARLAQALRGATDEVIVSIDVGTAHARSLLKQLARIAAGVGMRFSLCSQPESLVPGAYPARCIDARRVAALTGAAVDEATAARWGGCLCATASDIGTAPVEAGRGAALAPPSPLHDPHGEFLLPPPPMPVTESADLPF